MYNGTNGQAPERTHTTHEGAVTSTSLLRILPPESNIPSDPETSVAGGAGGGEVSSTPLVFPRGALPMQPMVSSRRVDSKMRCHDCTPNTAAPVRYAV